MKFAVWVWKLFTDAARAKNSSIVAIGLNLIVEFLFSVDFSPDIWYQSLYMKPFVHLTYVSVCGVKLWRYCSKSLTYASFLLLSFQWNCFHDFFSNFYVKHGTETQRVWISVMINLQKFNCVAAYGKHLLEVFKFMISASLWTLDHLHWKSTF